MICPSAATEQPTIFLPLFFLSFMSLYFLYLVSYSYFTFFLSFFYFVLLALLLMCFFFFFFFSFTSLSRGRINLDLERGSINMALVRKKRRTPRAFGVEKNFVSGVPGGNRNVKDKWNGHSYRVNRGARYKRKVVVTLERGTPSYTIVQSSNTLKKEKKRKRNSGCN